MPSRHSGDESDSSKRGEVFQYFYRIPVNLLLLFAVFLCVLMFPLAVPIFMHEITL
jgi:hypothetical protein